MAEPFPSLVLDHNYKTFEDDELNRPLINPSSLIGRIQRDTEDNGLDGIKDFRRAQALRRQQLNSNEDENILKLETNFNWDSISTTSRDNLNQRWRRMQKSFFISCVSSTLIIFWGFVSVVEQSLLVFGTAAFGSITSFLSLSFEPKLYMATRLSDELKSENAGSIRDDLAHLQERNQYLEEEVKHLKETIERQENVLHDFSEMRHELSKQKATYRDENEKLIKEIAKCKALDKLLDDVFAVFLRKVNSNYYDDELEPKGDLEKLVYSNLQSQLDSTSRGFDFKQVQKIISQNKKPLQQPSSEQTCERKSITKSLDEKCAKKKQFPVLIPLGNANRMLNTTNDTNDCL